MLEGFGTEVFSVGGAEGDDFAVGCDKGCDCCCL